MHPRTVFFDFSGTLAQPIAEPLDVWTGIAKLNEEYGGSWSRGVESCS
ncbi:MAG TPA: hypothetical protein VEM95_06340 [Thermoplasmata archaeon]|nr:hypothetical protein [Thermoplasmata archaeon]